MIPENDKQLNAAPEYLEALVGHTLDGVPVYDYNRLIPLISRLHECNPYEAADWVEHSTVGVPGAPIIIQLLEDE